MLSKQLFVEHGASPCYSFGFAKGSLRPKTPINALLAAIFVRKKCQFHDYLPKSTLSLSSSPPTCPIPSVIPITHTSLPTLGASLIVVAEGGSTAKNRPDGQVGAKCLYNRPSARQHDNLGDVARATARIGTTPLSPPATAPTRCLRFFLLRSQSSSCRC
jgi:hypothetical protein